jgi:hypothetical protein
MGQLLEVSAADEAEVWFDALMVQHVHDQVVFGGVGLVTLVTLPSLVVSVRDAL